jgi:hypothetical protein
MIATGPHPKTLRLAQKLARPVVLVLVERGGPRVIEAGASVDQATLRGLFQRYVPLSSRICSDSAGCY